jgi:hypothetical protein
MGSKPTIRHRPSTLSSVTRIWDAVLLGGSLPTTTVGLPKTSTAARLSDSDTDAAVGTTRVQGGTVSAAAEGPGQSRSPRRGSQSTPHDRWLRFDERKKCSVVANAAIPRELAGWCWSLAVLND